MQSGLFWRQTVTALHERDYADVQLDHMYADNCAMQLVRNPRQFDVIVTSNIFGDLLSDLASMLTGSLGMLPSATLGPADASGKRLALYEPIHGSAPDIAGKGIANPMAQIFSFAMLLRYSFGMDEDAALIERACTNVLASGLRTADIMAPGTQRSAPTSWASRSCANWTSSRPRLRRGGFPRSPAAPPLRAAAVRLRPAPCRRPPASPLNMCRSCRAARRQVAEPDSPRCCRPN